MIKKLKSLLSKVGPGFISGAADDDPSGITTYSILGASQGLKMLWLVPLALPMMIVIQEICGRIGKVTGDGLVVSLKKYYPKSILIIALSLLCLVNTINIGADLGMMAASIQMIYGQPLWLWIILISVITIILEIYIPYKIYSKFLIILGLSLLSYVITSFLIKSDWTQIILSTFNPTIRLNMDFLILIVAYFGTTISPYLFFWQSTNEVEEEIANGEIKQFGQKEKFLKKRLNEMKIETGIGMLFSQIITWFIIIVCGLTLFPAGIFNIESAHQAASALRPLAGDWAFLLFAVGIIGIGLQSIPVLAGGVAYGLAEIFNLPEGLSKSLTQAKFFYAVIAVTTLIGMLFNLFGLNPIQMLFYTAIISGVIGVPLIAIILSISNNREIMGSNTNGKITNIIGYITLSVMAFCCCILILDQFI